MANYTSLATLHGEIFTEKNPAFVKVLNELGINMKDLQPLIETIISESGKTHDILSKQTNYSLNELDKTVKLLERKFRQYITEKENIRVRKSTDVKPIGREGHTLFMWDTYEVYLHDGDKWRDIT